MKTIYIVRHCKADGQDREAKLTNEGLEQAEQLKDMLIDRQIDCIISSPYIRAQQSIKPLSIARSIEITLDERLIERGLMSEADANWKEMLAATFEDLTLKYEGGESSQEAMRRIISVINDIQHSAFNSTLFVSHGNLITLLLKHYDSNIGFKDWEKMSNPDVFELTFDNDVKPSIKRLWKVSENIKFI